MEQIKGKGDVFTVMPDGTVLKRISSFGEIFACYKNDGTPKKEEWEIAWHQKMYEDWRRWKKIKSREKAKLERARLKFLIIGALILMSLVLTGAA